MMRRSVVLRQAPLQYKKGSAPLVPPRWTIEGNLASDRTPAEKMPREMSDRTWKPQKFYFDVNRRYRSSADQPVEYLQRNIEFYGIETKMIWAAFDKPETIPRILGDYLRLGYTDAFRPEWIEAAIHWTTEARFWRCLGIATPFYDANRLRIHCWENDNLDIGRIQFSLPMKEAVMDMERALKRKAQGLEPNYQWDKWGPIGNVDGTPTDFLPRNVWNPYVDPDGVDVSDEDIAPYSTAESLKERYEEFITVNPTAYEGSFMGSYGHSNLTLDDIPVSRVKELYLQLKQAEGDDAGGEPDPKTYRELIHLCVNPDFLENEAISSASTWGEVSATLETLVGVDVNEKIDAARLLYNTTREANMNERYLEEKCGWRDFMFTPDRQITNGVMAYLQALRLVALNEEWGQALCRATTMIQREQAMGAEAFKAFRYLEDLCLERRRATWANRFSAPANEEKAIDHMMSQWNKRTESVSSEKNTLGESFDREFDPIGRKVQRRILQSDLQADTQERQSKVNPKKEYDPFQSLNMKQFKTRES